MSPFEREFMCNEFEDIGFYVMDTGTVEQDIERIRELIEFIRHNDITFDMSNADDDEG